MTILHLDHGREMRGGQWQVLRLLRGLRKRGHQPILLARSKGPLLENAQRENFRCDVIGPGSIRSICAEVQLVHAHCASSHTMAAMFATKPLIVSRRVVFPVAPGLLSYWKYSRPKRFAAISVAVEQQLKRAGVAAERITVIYDGVPLLSDRWRFNGPVVIPQFNDERKGNALPLEAAREAGAPILRSSKLEADLEGASALLYVTESEGLGSAALLAMSGGIPVIASNTGGLREVVQHGENGLLVANNVVAIAAAIRSLRVSEELTRNLSLKARRTVAERFSEDRMVEETLRLYGTVLNGG
jgi:hypothetical protein